MQWFILMTIRTRHLSIFQYQLAFDKKTQDLYLFPVMVFSLVVPFIFYHVPALQNALGSIQFPVEYWFPSDGIPH
jgi:sodium/potassium-transporting ATPase subunit alpha